MKREIKFRAWDGEKMYNIMGFTYHHQSKYDADNNIKTIGIYFENKNYEVYNVGLSKNIEIMQFTGLHDKNGNEIYEGDVILNPLATEPEHKGWCVRYNKSWFEAYNVFYKVESDEIDAYLLGEFNLAQFEVIGNIYQNKDLYETSTGT